jgi:hypothetical protein
MVFPVLLVMFMGFVEGLPTVTLPKFNVVEGF